MKKLNLKTISYFVTFLLIFTFVFMALAQGGGAPEDWHLKYGREYYEAGDFDMAAMYFRQAIGMNPKSAKSYFYLGQAYLKLKKTEEAKAAFEKAVELDSSLKKEVIKIGGSDEETEEDSDEKTDETTSMKSRTDNAPFQIGDEVEAKLYTSEQWVRGTVIASRDQFGDGRAFIYKVRYRDRGSDWLENEFYPGRVRAASKASNSQKKQSSADGNALFYADYVCTLDYFSGGQRHSEQQGILTLKAGGTYTFRGSSGRYKYNSGTGEITWTSGYLSADENSTKFQRNKTTAQIDITFKTSKGNLEWSCGTNLK